MSHHAQWVSMDTVPLKEKMKCVVKRVVSTKVLHVTSPISMVTMFFYIYLN